MAKKKLKKGKKLSGTKTVVGIGGTGGRQRF
jgi:hypothetical protein